MKKILRYLRSSLGYLYVCFKWVILAALVGCVVGPFGAMFGLALNKATALRTADPRLIYLLPLGGLVIVFLYQHFDPDGGGSTNQIFVAVREHKPLSLRTAPLIFVTTIITHLFGGSSGREGAALLLGGSLSGQIGRRLQLEARDCRLMTMCGMAGAFSAVFGTPLAATVFTLEVVDVGSMQYAALLPCLISALIGVWISSGMGLAPTAFAVADYAAPTPGNLIRVLLLGLLLAALSIAFCEVIHAAPKLYKKLFPNAYLRVVVGGALIIALTTLLISLTIIFLIVIVTLYPIGLYSGVQIQMSTLIALMVCLIPTTIGGLLSAIGIAGMDRALRANVITKSGKAVETAGDIDTLLLDKTGTITIGNRKATGFYPVDGFGAREFVRLCVLSSVSDPTPEGKSIVELGAEQGIKTDPLQLVGVHMVKFTAETKCSGVDMPDGRRIRKGASEAILRMCAEAGHECPAGIEATVRRISENGGTPLIVCEDERIRGVVELQDIIKTGIRERFERLRKMGVKTVMVTGDNPLTAKYIAEQAGVDDFIAEARPEDKLEYIRREQRAGKLVAMMGDGTNDAPALAQADVGVAMNSGTQAAKEAGNMVDLDNDPTKLIEIVEIGKQLLMTRGTLTTFSIANDVAKYFAIVPALFIASIPSLQALNIMHLDSPESAILSAVIFNAVIIPLLIPLALRGVTYKPIGASALLRRNLFIYGLGGVIVPFVGIKLIDMLVSVFF